MRLAVSLAVAAVSLLSTGAMAQTAAEQAACRSDFLKFCAGTKPGGGRGLACLAKQKDKLEAACRQVIEAHSQ
ncbi:MAG: cysteine rich repeat-containing protein [Hyphomicrobiales bacterium]